MRSAAPGASTTLVPPGAQQVLLCRYSGLGPLERSAATPSGLRLLAQLESLTPLRPDTSGPVRLEVRPSRVLRGGVMRVVIVNPSARWYVWGGCLRYQRWIAGRWEPPPSGLECLANVSIPAHSRRSRGKSRLSRSAYPPGRYRITLVYHPSAARSLEPRLVTYGYFTVTARPSARAR